MITINKNGQISGGFLYSANADGKSYLSNSPGKIKTALRKARVSENIKILCNGEFCLWYKPQLSRRKRL